DDYHLPVVDFLAQCTGQAITTTACATEVMWLLNDDWRVQNEFLAHVAQGIYRCEPLMPDDFERIAQLNAQYADLPGDFSDLSLVVISERLGIPAIATLDQDFDVYRRCRRQPFECIFRP
ncbi:type II toxin-antitoxin system VapC family toxin, partial [Spirulina subsalsa]